METSLVQRKPWAQSGFCLMHLDAEAKSSNPLGKLHAQRCPITIYYKHQKLVFADQGQLSKSRYESSNRTILKTRNPKRGNRPAFAS